MAYEVIARKWRPQIFDEVVGQEAITRTLRNAVEQERLHHAYLFTGARGVGKTTTARILAKALNCRTGVTVTPCGVCASCTEIAAGGSLDVIEIDAASHTGVDNIRDVVINSVGIAPARDRYKVFIVDEVHQLSGAAFNALLKTLEEPPSRVVFVLATTELHKVPDTIASRCQLFEFKTIPLTKIQAKLGANIANLLTVARLCLAVPIVLLVRSGDFPSAAALFLIAALSDGLDGFVAKRFSGVTPLGTVLDPIADKVLMASLFVTLAIMGHLPVWIVVLVLARDVLIVLGTLLLRIVAGELRVEPLLVGKASTLMQILLGATVLVQLSILPDLELWVDLLLLLTAATVLASAIAYLRAAARTWVAARAAR